MSLPARGVWIEIINFGWLREAEIESFPARGVWIEMAGDAR